jgi:hypothetical protein
MDLPVFYDPLALLLQDKARISSPVILQGPGAKGAEVNMANYSSANDLREVGQARLCI